MFCGTCGNQIPDGSTRCEHCGKILTPQPPVQQAPIQQNPVYQQPPVYQNPGYPQTPVRNPNDGRGLSITALVLGICGVVFAFIPVASFIVLACSILGIIFGFKGRQKSTAAYGKPSGLATAGFIMGIVGASICALGVLSYLACFGVYGCAYCEVMNLVSNI